MPTHPFIPAPNTAQVTMQYNVGGEHCENVYWVQGAAPWDATTLLALIGKFRDWEAADASPIRSNFVGLYNIHARDFTVQNGPELDQSESIGGALTAEPFPQNVTVAVKAQTGLAGRSFRGRSYWIGLEIDQQLTQGVLLPATATAIITVMNQLLASAFPNTGKMVVASFRTGGNPRTTAVLTPILSYTMADHNIDSQRRRLPGHNRHR